MKVLHTTTRPHDTVHRQKARLQPILLLAITAMLCLFGACSNIDCPLDNVVMMQCNLYSAETRQALSLPVNLTVKPAGRDTVLLNQASDIKSFLLPLKDAGGRDTLLLNLSNTAGQEATDTLFVTHTVKPHFESLDCPASVFHTITGVSATHHALSILPLTVDSIALIRPTVNYDDIENIRLFLRSTSGH